MPNERLFKQILAALALFAVLYLAASQWRTLSVLYGDWSEPIHVGEDAPEATDRVSVLSVLSAREASADAASSTPSEPSNSSPSSTVAAPTASGDIAAAASPAALSSQSGQTQRDAQVRLIASRPEQPNLQQAPRVAPAQAVVATASQKPPMPLTFTRANEGRLAVSTSTSVGSTESQNPVPAASTPQVRSRWTGAFEGADSGSFTFELYDNGTVVGRANSIRYGRDGSFQGRVGPDGTLKLLPSSNVYPAPLSAKGLLLPDTASGTWLIETTPQAYTGTWRAKVSSDTRK